MTSVDLYTTMPFRPVGNVTIAASTTSARQALPLADDQSVVISNPTTSVAFVNLGNGSVDAADTNFPILPGQSRIIRALTSETHIAAILASGTGNIYVSVGQGI